MCGRFALDIPKKEFVKRFRVKQMEIQLTPHYNVAPGMFIPTIRKHDDTTEAVLMKWGLVPHWSKEPKVRYATINARKETIQTSAVYKEPFKKNRCLIPAIGFYEWARIDPKQKIPYYIHFSDNKPFSFAGLWDSWVDVEGKEFLSCSIVTCDANDVMKAIHSRMPVIIHEHDEESWINPSENEGKLLSLLEPFNGKALEVTRISEKVNFLHHDDKSIIDINSK